MRSRLDSLEPLLMPYAHDGPACESLLDSINTVRPSHLIGSGNHACRFTEDQCQLMAEINARPLIFALSNRPEVASQDAYEWTQGR